MDKKEIEQNNKVVITHKEFIELLKKAKLNKKKFSELTSLAYSTVVNWSRKDNVPNWIKSWLENYVKANETALLRGAWLLDHNERRNR